MSVDAWIGMVIGARSMHLSQCWAAVILAGRSDLVTLNGFLSSYLKESLLCLLSHVFRMLELQLGRG